MPDTVLATNAATEQRPFARRSPIVTTARDRQGCREKMTFVRRARCNIFVLSRIPEHLTVHARIPHTAMFAPPPFFQKLP